MNAEPEFCPAKLACDARIAELEAELQRKDDTIDRVIAICHANQFGTVRTSEIERAVHGCGTCRGCDRLRDELVKARQEAADNLADYEELQAISIEKGERLAAVIALCEQHDNYADWRYVRKQIRAAATGEQQ